MMREKTETNCYASLVFFSLLGWLTRCCIYTMCFVYMCVYDQLRGEVHACTSVSSCPKAVFRSQTKTLIICVYCVVYTCSLTRRRGLGEHKERLSITPCEESRCRVDATKMMMMAGSSNVTHTRRGDRRSRLLRSNVVTVVV